MQIPKDEPTSLRSWQSLESSWQWRCDAIRERENCRATAASHPRASHLLEKHGYSGDNCNTDPPHYTLPVCVYSGLHLATCTSSSADTRGYRLPTNSSQGGKMPTRVDDQEWKALVTFHFAGPKLSGRDNLREKGCTLSYRLRGYCTAWWGRH